MPCHANQASEPDDKDSQSPLALQHWLSEQVLDWADIGAVHIRPTLFGENLAIFGAATIATPFSNTMRLRDGGPFGPSGGE